MMRLEAEIPGFRRLLSRFDVPLSVCGPLGDISPEEKKAIIESGLERGLTEEQTLEEYTQLLLDL